MKLVRYRPNGSATPQVGVLREDEIFELDKIKRFSPALQVVTRDGPDRLSKLITDDEPIPRQQVELLAPVGSDGRVFCLGGVYTGHLEEAGLSLMTDPNQWVMPENAIVGPDDPIVLPKRVAQNVKPAAELCVVIGKPGKYIDPTDAYDHVAGYTISNDVTARTEWPGPMGYKLMDSFSPIGPFVRSADDVPNPSELKITMRQGGDPICQGSTAGMRFTLSFMVSYLSIITELRPGDVISTGDPGGVESTLSPGSSVEITIENVGTLRNLVELEQRESVE